LDKREIFEFLVDRLASGRRVALVSLVDAFGSSMRDPGAHMAVDEDGAFVGSLSGGCIERAVIAEAGDAIAEGVPRVTRFGQGSRYIDIRLPCGGGLDLHFQPLLKDDLPRQALDAINSRQPFALELRTDAQPPSFISDWHPTGWDTAKGIATIGHWPNPRVLIVGHGAVVAKLAEQARAWGAEIAIITPDKVLADALRQDGFDAVVIGAPTETRALISDAWTAVVFLFHDHDWEPALIAHALEQPHFFIGAMGSKRAHAARCEALRTRGVSQAAIAGISAPIGVFHSVRDPATLAISVLAEVADRFRNQGAFAAQLPELRKTNIRQIG
jgi:xanthine dehydrogenase accessory factor